MIYWICRWIVQRVTNIVFRVECIDAHHEPSTGPVVVCSNHRNNWDPPLVGSYLQRQVHFMAKAELFRIPVLAQLLRAFGTFPVNRGGMSKDSIKTAVRLLKEGKMLCVFPEGSRQAALGAGKKGAASMAMRGGATVLPVAVIGDYRPFSPMKIVIGEPLDLSAFAELPPSEQLDAATEQIMASIRTLIERHS